MKGLESKLLPGLIAAVGLYLGYATLVGGLPLLVALRAIELRALAVALLLVAVNFLLRFRRPRQRPHPTSRWPLRSVSRRPWMPPSTTMCGWPD